jgi:UDP-glucose 4-epimerase
MGGMKIFVTGGAGYIGSVVVDQLVAEGMSVVVFDNLSQGHRAAVHPKAVFMEADLADRASIDRALSEHRPDAVMHFAGRTLVGESMDKPLLYLGESVRCGLNLLESMIEHQVKRFILSSTANLFGAPQRVPITEEEPIAPGSPYGESKHFLERMVHWLDRTCGMRYIALRYFNAAGATEEYGEDHHPESHLIPIVLQVALGQRPDVAIFGGDYPTPDGTCVRDYIHVADLAQAHLLALAALDHGSRQYNLGNGTGYSVQQVVETARRITGHPIPAQVGPRRAGDPATLVASSEKIRRELGWHPRLSDLKSILESAWRWHQRHPHGYGDR